MTFSFPSFLFLCCFHLLAPLLCTTSDAALSSPIIRAINCSSSGNYTSADAYAANLKQLLAALPENAVSKNGGFFNGTVGEGPDTVYGLAMCPADYSRGDCGDCLTAVAGSDASGLQSRCPGSKTVLAMFDQCLVRYSDRNFFGTAEIGAIYATSGDRVVTGLAVYSATLTKSLRDGTEAAMISPQRFGSSVTDPYVLVQCTWDLSADKCKQCLDVLSNNVSGVNAIRREGLQKSYSCSVRYSNTSFMVVPLNAAGTGPTPKSVDQMGTSSRPSSGSGNYRVATVVGIVIAVLVMASLAALLWYVCKLVRERNTISVRYGKFTYQQLAGATRNFADDEKLGEGAFGAVYKGKLEMVLLKKQVAIKKITNAKSARVRGDFANEIEIMKLVNHRNIVHLVGSCDENDNLLLVYELVDNGTLEEKLYPVDATRDAQLYNASEPGTTSHLDWPNRCNILIGVASGLAYLHTECRECLLHRDIKPSNVMLDRSFNAKLCDFGLVTQVRHTQNVRATNTICGTSVYMDPEYIANGTVNNQSDVYSFGVVLLEVVCGQRPRLENGNKNTLVEKVMALHERNAILDAADTRLRGQYDERIKRMLMVGLLCVQPERRHRPLMIDVKEYLRKTEVPLPPLSSEYTTCATELPADPLLG